MLYYAHTAMEKEYMATLNLYLPDALKAEMDTFGGINWSAVAQEAYRAAIIQKKAGTMDTDAIVERLKRTDGKNSKGYKRGYEEGRTFAAERATVDQLDDLASFPIEQHVETVGELPMELAKWLVQAIQEEAGKPFDDSDLHQYFDTEFDGELKMSVNRIRGFLDGAASVYSAVKAKL